MDNDEFEKRMRELEYFHGLRTLDNVFLERLCVRSSRRRFTSKTTKRPPTR